MVSLSRLESRHCSPHVRPSTNCHAVHRFCRAWIKYQNLSCLDCYSTCSRCEPPAISAYRRHNGMFGNFSQDRLVSQHKRVRRRYSITSSLRRQKSMYFALRKCPRISAIKSTSHLVVFDSVSMRWKIARFKRR